MIDRAKTLYARRDLRLFVVLIICVGILLRLILYMQRPSLWIDEAMLALNILMRSFTELLRPLDFEQVAPTGFLILERVMVVVFGPGERALRALPMLSGCAMVILFPFILSKTVHRAALIPATLLIALSPLLVRYANEVKPYSTDALVALVILGWTLRSVRAPQPFPLVTLATIGCIAIALSIPSVFVLLPSLLCAAYLHARSRDHRAVMGAVVIGSIWLAGLWMFRKFIYNADAATNAYLERFWEGGYYFARSDLSLADKLNLTIQDLLQSLFGRTDFISLPITLLALATLAAGTTHYLTRQRREGLIVLGPMILTLVAFVAEQYVISGRTILFLAPSLALLVGHGIALLSEAGRGSVKTVLVATLTVPLVTHQVTVLREHTLTKDPAITGVTRAAISLLLERAGPDEPIYVFARTMPLWIYYTTNWQTPDTLRVNWWVAAAAAAGPNSGNGPPIRTINGGPYQARSYRESWELAGSRTGMQTLAGVSQQSADLSAWARRDLARVREHAHPTAWALFSQEMRPFHAFLSESRRQQVEIDFENQTLLVAQLRFPD